MARFKRRLSPVERAQIVQDYQSGRTSIELAKQHGMGKVTVLRLLREAGVEVRCQGLNPDDIPQVIRLYGQGWSLARIGDRYGCDSHTVRRRLLEAGVQTRPRRGA